MTQNKSTTKASSRSRKIKVVITASTKPEELSIKQIAKEWFKKFSDRRSGMYHLTRTYGERG